MQQTLGRLRENTSNQAFADLYSIVPATIYIHVPPRCRLCSDPRDTSSVPKPRFSLGTHQTSIQGGNELFLDTFELVKRKLVGNSCGEITTTRGHPPRSVSPSFRNIPQASE